MGIRIVDSRHDDVGFFGLEQLRQRGIPTVMLLSGGYSRESYQLVFRSVDELIRRYRD